LSTRKLLPNDLEQLYQMYSDAVAMQYRGASPMTKRSEAHEMIQQQVVYEHGVQKRRLAVVLNTNQQLIGTLLLKFNDRSPNKCEMGYSFDPKEWNKGYGSETIQMTLKAVREQLNIQQVHAWCRKDNAASAHILQKNGFQLQPQLEFPESFLYIRIL